MFRAFLLVLTMALGLAVSGVQAHDPMPHCFPCPYSR